jgi:hypothetical protein
MGGCHSRSAISVSSRLQGRCRDAHPRFQHEGRVFQEVGDIIHGSNSSGRAGGRSIRSGTGRVGAVLCSKLLDRWGEGVLGKLWGRCCCFPWCSCCCSLGGSRGWRVGGCDGPDEPAAASWGVGARLPGQLRLLGGAAPGQWPRRAALLRGVPVLKGEDALNHTWPAVMQQCGMG